MIIFWGKRTVQKRLGRVADWCDLCREPRAFEVTEYREVSHIYLIALDKGTVSHHEKTCETCGSASIANPNFYLTISDDPNATLEQLFAATNPKLVERNRGKIDQIEKVKSGELTAEQRTEAIVDALRNVLPQIDRRVKATCFDVYSSIGCGGMITLIVLNPLLWANGFSRPVRDGLLYAAGMLLLWTVYLVLTDASRYAERVLFPRIVPQLKPVNPTEQELREALQRLRKRGFKGASKISPRKLHKAVLNYGG